MTHGFGGFFLLLGGGCGCSAGCRAGAGPGFRCVLFWLQITMKIKILNLIKTKSTLSFWGKSLWCTAGIFAVTNNDSWQVTARMVYIVWVWPQLSIPTPEINQSSWDESGKYFSPFCLSVRACLAWCGLLVRGQTRRDVVTSCQGD